MDILTVIDARELTAQICIMDEGLWALLATAYQGRAWKVLGYTSWDGYVRAEFGSLKIRIPKEDRREIMSNLRDHGLSLGAIATATGYDKRTVANDLVVAAPHLATRQSKARHNCRPVNPLCRAVTDMTKVGNKLAKLISDGALPPESLKQELQSARDVLDRMITMLDQKVA